MSANPRDYARVRGKWKATSDRFPRGEPLSFTIQIRDPNAGWLHARIVLGKQEFDLMFSEVANDPLRELAELGLFLVSNERFACGATFWLEPEGYELRASRDEELLLAMHYSDSAFANLFPPAKTLVSLAIDGPCVASEIVRALRVVEEQLAASERPGWCHPFPIRLIEQLERKLL